MNQNWDFFLRWIYRIFPINRGNIFTFNWRLSNAQKIVIWIINHHKPCETFEIIDENLCKADVVQFLIKMSLSQWNFLSIFPHKELYATYSNNMKHSYMTILWEQKHLLSLHTFDFYWNHFCRPLLLHTSSYSCTYHRCCLETEENGNRVAYVAKLIWIACTHTQYCVFIRKDFISLCRHSFKCQ